MAKTKFIEELLNLNMQTKMHKKLTDLCVCTQITHFKGPN